MLAAMSTSHFFAYLSRMKFIRRWGLMHSTYPENIQEHSLRVAQIAHALAIIRNRLYGGEVSPERTAVLALYHDTSEVLTGDLPAPVKEFNPEIHRAYHAIEAASKEKLFGLIPDPLKPGYEPFFRPDPHDHTHRLLVRAADKLCAYLSVSRRRARATRSSPRRRRACARASRASIFRRCATSWRPSCRASG